MQRTGLLRVRRALWGMAAVAILATGGAFPWQALSPPRPEAVRVTGEADIRNAYTLTDHTGRAVTAADSAGRWQMVFSGFTDCPDICPTTLAYMATATDLRGPEAGQVAPIFITLGPARDSVAVMAQFVAAFHPRLVGLTGTEAQVAGAAGNFRAYHEKMADAAAPDGYLMAHSGYIHPMRPDGRFEAVFREGGQPPEELADEISMPIEKDDRAA